MFFVLDEPCLSLKDIENGLSKCNSIKYAAYRAAAKLRLVQKAFYMEKIQLKVISCVFERHQLQQTENSVQLNQNEVESLLSDIYFYIKKENNILLDVDYLSHLMLSFLLSVFDKKVSNTIQVFSFKVGLTLLCDAKPREKYRYLFEQLADYNNCLSRKKLEILLERMIRLTEYIGEELSFGSKLIPGTVESCFQCNPGGLGLSENVFMEWLMQDPQLLVWLSTLYRMQISESVTHNAKCDICKIYPLKGLRYRCLRCLSYDMCQLCFFTGKVNKKHKLKHPVQEYCCPMTSQQTTKAFLLTLRNRLYKKDCKLQYLPALRVDSPVEETLGGSTRLLDEMETSSKTLINGSRMSLNRFPYKELQNIILQLEKESEKIIPQIDNFCSEADNSQASECKTHLKNCLMKHKAQVRAQVHRLKLLRNYLASNARFDAKAFLASTPVVDEILSKSQKRDFNIDFNSLSPITVRNKKPEGTECEKKMMWDNYDLGTQGANASWEEVQTVHVENNISEMFGAPNEVTVIQEGGSKDDESKFQLTSWLGGKTLRELESSSKKGFTWLYENGVSEEDKIREENEETLEELQCDLKEILRKLQELSVVTSRGEFDEGDSMSNTVIADIDTMGEVDTLLVDLINGIDKLMGS